MTIKRLIWILIALIVFGIIVIPKLINRNKKEISAKPSGKNTPIKVSVFVAAVEPSSEFIKVSGNVLAMEEVELRSETQGRVVKIGFDEGTEVSKGQLLVKINDADLQAQLKRAISTQKLKSETEKRNKPLLEKGAISQEVYDNSFSELNAVNADVDLIREQIRKTEIRAPFSGSIGLRYISEGSYVTNASKIASIHTLDKVKLEFSVSEKYASRLTKGSKITFTVEGMDTTYLAQIYAIEPQVNAATRNVLMRAICDNKQHRILPGAFASIRVDLGLNTNTLMIPTQSVVPILKGHKVYVVHGDSATEKKVKIGNRNDTRIEIKEGLSPGDSVIVNGVMYMRQGSKIILGK